MNPVLEMIQKYATMLKKSNISNGKQEIIWYLESKNLLSQEQLYSNNYMVSQSIETAIKSYYGLRSTKAPYQYIVNSANFYGREFYVDQRVLIPRPETEQIIEIVKKLATPFSTCLEIGVGSGCIALTLCIEKLVKSIIGSDISPECLEVANINQKRYNINNMTLLQHNILSENFKQKFDLIISNPPYITNDEYHALPTHIKDFEPQIALTDFHDGLVFYKRFSNLLPEILASNGTFICELGSYHLISSIKNIFCNAGYAVTVYNDLNRDPRFLVILPSA